MCLLLRAECIAICVGINAFSAGVNLSYAVDLEKSDTQSVALNTINSTLSEIQITPALLNRVGVANQQSSDAQQSASTQTPVAEPLEEAAQYFLPAATVEPVFSFLGAYHYNCARSVGRGIRSSIKLAPPIHDLAGG